MQSNERQLKASMYIHILCIPLMYNLELWNRFLVKKKNLGLKKIEGLAFLYQIYLFLLTKKLKFCSINNYKYKLAAKTMSLFRSLMDSENLFSKSVLPIFFAA